ncbi:putative ribonuclease H-like domain-containing protein [Tanacetum coccineum]|uniref:Ribonuclease H-like domain-containing protein n=1 Tax=Tanacetum coccineum TaxID=301880 RepID=A0ABQ4ZZ46_9ASTR
MDLEIAQTTTTAKLPILKHGEYDMWRLRIEQYFQVQDYALWDVIENGNSFKPVPQTTTNADGSSTSLIPGPVTTKEKVQNKNDVKARSMLLMALPNEHLMTFNQYKDAQTLFAAIQTRFAGNEATKKTQKTLLKQITNEVNTAYGVSTANTQVNPASTQVSTASTQVSTANLSDDTVYAFLSSQPNRSQLVYEDLEQIHEDDIEEMDLKWQLALLSMRTRRGPRNQDSRNRNQDSSRRTVNVEETSSKAMVAIDEAGFDWSYMADDEVPTNMALMAFSDSEVHNDKTCSKTCLKSFETLKTQVDDLRIEFNKSEFNLATYKRGLVSIEEQLVFYKKNEVIFYEQLAVLKRDISYKNLEISMLKSELEKLKQEKESNQLKIENFNNASKSLDKLLGSQITDKSRKGVGFLSYNVVSPPPTGLFSPSNLDLSYSGLKKFQQPKFEGYRPKTSKSVSEDISNEVRESPDALLVKELVSDDKLEKKTVIPTADYNYHQRERVVSGNNYTKVNYNYSAKKTHPSAHGNIVPRAVLMKTGLRPLNTARPVNTAHPKTTVYSAIPMPNSVVVNAVRAHQVNAIKASADFKEFDGGYVTFGGGAKRGKITGKGTPKTVFFLLTLNVFLLSPDFKLADESQVLLKVPRKNNMYSVDMKNIVPKESLTCLVAKATLDESILWHRRLGHVNFKTINKLVKENLVRGLPIKHFENDQPCVACLKGKQHKASCKSKIRNSITQPLFMLHMDLFGPTFISNLINKKYYLVVTDDYSRFTWVFFLATKDETSGILKSFITEVENLVDKKVKIIRCDNGTEFKNRVMSEFCEKKGIKKEFSVARTPQQNGVAERRNKTLIEAARTMLADSKLPTTF